KSHITCTERFIHWACQHLWTNDRVVFGEGFITFDLKISGYHPRDRMKEKCLLHGGDEGMPDAAQHGMVRPDRQRVFAILLQGLCIMDHHLLTIFGSNVEVRCQRRVEDPLSSAKLLGMDICVGSGVTAIFI